MPPSIVPTSLSPNIANAACCVKPRNASTRDSCWSLRSGSPSADGFVVTAEKMPFRTSTLSTGKSLPNATGNDSASSSRHA